MRGSYEECAGLDSDGIDKFTYDWCLNGHFDRDESI